MPMSGFEPGDVVRVPFPHTDGEARQHRPRLVVAQTGRGEGSGMLLRELMISFAENRGRSSSALRSGVCVGGAHGSTLETTGRDVRQIDAKVAVSRAGCSAFGSVSDRMRSRSASRCGGTGCARSSVASVNASGASGRAMA